MKFRHSVSAERNAEELLRLITKARLQNSPFTIDRDDLDVVAKTIEMLLTKIDSQIASYPTP